MPKLMTKIACWEIGMYKTYDLIWRHNRQQVAAHREKALFMSGLPASITTQKMEGILEMEADCNVDEICLMKVSVNCVCSDEIVRHHFLFGKANSRFTGAQIISVCAYDHMYMYMFIPWRFPFMAF